MSELEETIVSSEAAMSPPLTRGVWPSIPNKKEGSVDLVSH